MFCRKCGNEIDGHDKFCSNCGEPVALEPEEPAVIIPEPPKDLVWNIEGYPTDKKDKKVEDVIFDWKTDNQGEDFAVDNFYIDDRKNISAQKLLDREVEKINLNTLAREEAILKAREASQEQTSSTEEDELEAVVPAEEAVAKDDVKEEATEGSNPESTLDSNPESTLDLNLESTLEAERAEDIKPEKTESASPGTMEKIILPVTNNNEENFNEAIKTELKYEDIFVEDANEENEAKVKGSTFRKFILAIIIILLIVEAAFLGARHFIPDNPIVKMLNDKVTQVVLTVESWFQAKEPVAEPAKEPEALDNAKVEDSAEAPPLAEEPVNPYPENKNIKTVSMNPNLVYVSGKDYGNVDINKSLPVTEDTDAVIKAIVAYDSRWIDYVNKGDKGVLDLTAPGSPAEKSTLSFTKVGKIYETFNSLEMGDVRKGVKGYYVWVREQIQIQENGTDTAKVYNWIYQVTPIENEMKIVNYFSYK